MRFNHYSMFAILRTLELLYEDAGNMLPRKTEERQEIHSNWLRLRRLNCPQKR